MTPINQPLFDMIDNGHVNRSGTCGLCKAPWPCSVIRAARQECRPARAVAQSEALRRRLAQR